MGFAALTDTQYMSQGKTVIIGLGKTGLSCARFLVDRGVEVVVMDSQSEPAGLEALRRDLPEVSAVLGGLDAALLCEAQQLVVSPGVPLRHPAIAAALAKGVEIIGDIELFARYAKAPVIAVTGSNGKSTVTSLVYEMARQAGKEVRVGGNIGTPALELLQAQEPDLYVLELSSFQMETTHSLNAAAAVVLNISQDHLDRYQGMDDYMAAKRQIYQGSGVMVINRDDPMVSRWGEMGRNCVGFTLATPAVGDFGLRQHQGEEWLARGETPLMPAAEVRLVGRHNIANALAALALGQSVGLPTAAMLEVLRNFPGLAHRCQWVAEQDGINWYNDSKATNVGAAVAAIEGLSSPVVLIAGGLAKGQDFSSLRDAVVQKGRGVVLMGRDASQIKAALGESVAIKYAANMGEAVSLARAMAQPGDAVLLSPACASFDMFSGYEERGDEFVEAVRRCLE